MRSIFVLALLGVALITVAIVVRSGAYGRRDPGLPINSAMREALGTQLLPDRDAMVIAQRFPGARETPRGLRYLIRSAGTGDETPQRGQWVTAHYDAWFLDGTSFDSSRQKDLGPLNFQVGAGNVIAGWDEAFLTMKRGEKRTLIIPYWLAYGEKGIRGRIPPKATLIFDVELLDFR
jgi:FKBP-type peptidyl-prolyl cis-trans isomerase